MVITIYIKNCLIDINFLIQLFEIYVFNTQLYIIL